MDKPAVDLRDPRLAPSLVLAPYYVSALRVGPIPKLRLVSPATTLIFLLKL